MSRDEQPTITDSYSSKSLMLPFDYPARPNKRIALYSTSANTARIIPVHFTSPG